ncbi:FadR/GntR family transcriptional regulator [uncultured Amnibacterium sp.]|uniref:FadR/GntR family transcriptional regulator n=1 Tax=uncultured Amnibacterium sp. TaxID=1631851 RepID=UPI0035C9F573
MAGKKLNEKHLTVELSCLDGPVTAPDDLAIRSGMRADEVVAAPGAGVVFRAVDSSRPTAAIVERIQSGISVGVLGDGQGLPSERELARLFDVPAFTLREALRALRSEGLIETRRGRGGGSFVRLPEGLNREVATRRLRLLSSAQIRDIGDWRQTLMLGAVTLAVDRADHGQVEHLVDHAVRVAHADSLTVARQVHSRFHLELAAASQSTRINAAEIELQASHGWLFGTVIDRASYRATASELFVQIAAAIDGRDRDSALDRTRDYLNHINTALLELRMAPEEQPS